MTAQELKDKIRSEIERLESIDYPCDNAEQEVGYHNALDRMRDFIDSLPEEPTPKGYDEAYLNECIAKASKTWKGVDVDKYMDLVRGREMARAEVRAIEQYPIEDGKMWTSAFGTFEFDRNYGERQAFQKGYEQAEKDLLANAIDAEIVRDIHNLLHVKSDVLPMPTHFKFGDKVKIIILKDETDNR